jgi:putative DNA primase/helicase
MVISLENLLDEARTDQATPNMNYFLEREQVGDAELFVLRFGDRVRYDRSAHIWYSWRDHYWEPDRTGGVLNLISKQLSAEYLRAGAEATEKGNAGKAGAFMERAKALMRTHRCKSTLEMIAVQPEIALTGDEWDTHPMLLPVANGVIDLTTGQCRAGQPDEYLRAHSPVRWMAIEYPAPRWERFISEVFREDAELTSFVQRLLGYCLTGKVGERRLPVLHGLGANGKSTLLQTLSYVFGDGLSFSTQADSLMDLKRDGSGPQPFVYSLRGRRLCWATESREGQRINSGLVKLLTGGDTITTRTLFTDVTTFKPSHKVFLLTNNKPHISAEDQAMWDRVLLIPFDIRFVDAPTGENERKRDQTLTERLEEETPGILAWLVRGCLQWQRDGLNPPAKVLAATEEYRQEEDTVADFVGDCLITGADKSAQAKDLYARYLEWAKENSNEHMTLQAFGKRMRRRFGEPTRTEKGKVYGGVGILL